MATGYCTMYQSWHGPKVNLIYLFRGGGGKGTDHDHDTLEFDPWSMVKKFDHGHCHPGMCPMVNGENGYFVVKLCG